jgi:hypothetical protein
MSWLRSTVVPPIGGGREPTIRIFNFLFFKLITYTLRVLATGLCRLGK